MDKNYYLSRVAKKLKPEQITLEVLEECQETMAEVIDRYGEVYLPIFDHITKLIKQKRKEDKSMQLVQEILAKKRHSKRHSNCHSESY